jgi:glycerol-3-phosphate cytidylyltransferase
METGGELLVGFTCGAFDLLHAGHALMLQECKQHCDYLIVGLQTDPSIDRASKNSPVMSLEERKIMISSIKYVDEVIVYQTERELFTLLSQLNYEHKNFVRIIGADWKGKEYTGHELPIEVIFNSRSHSYSTSELRKRVWEAEQQKLT